MKFDFCMPVKIFSGEECVQKNAEILRVGKKCLIVTGKHSAKKSGALDDIINALESLQIEYTIFDKVGENPLLSVCYAGGRAALENGADFVVGIGGGSPLDAAKAIAAFGANPGIEPMEIYCVSALRPSLPLFLIPTTAGTGSEVNPYAVLTLDGENKKKTFTSPYSYATAAFLDYRYTLSLNDVYTLSTAMDAFCHCLESYMSPKSTAVSEMFAVYGASALWRFFASHADQGFSEITPSERESLLFAACAGGIAINRTGTGFPHPMGYNITLHKGISHGRACGAFTGEYISHCLKGGAEERVTAFCHAIGTDPASISVLIPRLADVNIKLTETEIEDYVGKVKAAGNFKNCLVAMDESQMYEVYRRLFG